MLGLLPLILAYNVCPGISLANESVIDDTHAVEFMVNSSQFIINKTFKHSSSSLMFSFNQSPQMRILSQFYNRSIDPRPRVVIDGRTDFAAAIKISRALAG
jgi:hypothetical protein